MTIMTTPKQPQDRKKPAQPKPKSQPRGEAKEAPKTDLKVVSFQGREIPVKCPTEEQIFAWERLLTKMESMAKEAATVDSARILLNRCNKIIDSVVANEEDREWLEDGRLDGTVNLKDAAKIVVDALALYETELGKEPPNRAARRAKA
jgi:hypothetical protein